MKELKKILDVLLINNDKFISKNILEFVYPKCYNCSELKKYNELYDLYNSERICKVCIDYYNFIRCNLCARYYDYGDGYCRYCESPCKLYCYNCQTMNFERRIYISNIHMETESE